MTQREKADRFRKLHQGPDILILPNAWDAATARIFELEGFPALGTTSAGVAFSHGYADGQSITRDEMLAAVERITRAVSVPVTADVEAGYGDAVETAKRVAAAGAIGMNLEDVVGERAETLADLQTQTELIRAVRALELPLVVNARTDIYLAGIGEMESRFARTVERLNAFLDAGADCVFAPGVSDGETIARLAREIRGPLNILATKGSPSPRELQGMGVARVSVGSGPARAALGVVRRIAHELREENSYRGMLQDQVPYEEVNRMFRR